MTTKIKYTQMMWREKKSHGPDVEMIIYLPIAIAVESKPTPSIALKEIGQVIHYINSGLYDATFIRVENLSLEGSSDLLLLERLAKQYGIGIVAGGETYAPITCKDNIINPALLSLNGNPIKLYQKGGKMALIRQIADDSTKQIIDLTCFRKFFYTINPWGERQ